MAAPLDNGLHDAQAFGWSTVLPQWEGLLRAMAGRSS